MGVGIPTFEKLDHGVIRTLRNGTLEGTFGIGTGVDDEEIGYVV